MDGTSVAYAYNAQGIRTAKRVNNLRTAYLLDGGNVVAEVQNNTVTDNYLRGANLIRRTSAGETEYYLFNAHGDVVTTTNPNGTVNQSYDYDAFGNEKNPDALDTNPFRYCGEYLDAETGSYYLRARYYDPSIGRFTQQDTHWNTANMIYGDNPQKINECEDSLGLKTYSYAPQISAIGQSGNLYVYCINDPVNYNDASGEFVIGSVTVTASLGLAVMGAAINVITTVGAALLTNQTVSALDLGVAVLTGAAAGLSLTGKGLINYFVPGLAATVSAFYTGISTAVQSKSVGAGIVNGLAAGVNTFLNLSTFWSPFPTSAISKAGYLFVNAVSCTGNNLVTAAVCKTTVSIASNHSNVSKNHDTAGQTPSTVPSISMPTGIRPSQRQKQLPNQSIRMDLIA